ncbi:MAG: UDP-N-acetylglucosamine 1-carboxyvinyltransferase [Phascolarctobacterium sp.]|nr:UDP-N-acetylglucosamine 1-carboxyvinyltransferase [Candidatus Phascolarctobacterium caballi]
MEKLLIKGGKPLHGKVKVSGAKNAVLPIIIAALLAKTPSTFDDVPLLEDVRAISEVLKCLGVKVDDSVSHTLVVDSSNITDCEPPYELVSAMRASFLVLGPLLARKGKARISMPGGCAIGARPIDIHLKAFEALGVKIEQGHGYIVATAPNGIKGATVYFDFPSVGATEHVMMLASLAEGKTVLENVAQEPEIVDLANYLNKMGAKVRGAGTPVIKIEGVSELHGAEYTIIPDRIEAGTYMIAAAMTGGDVLIENVLPEHQKPLTAKLREAGAVVEEDVDRIHVVGSGKLKAVDIKTLPYPGFPTDMQAQMMAMLVVAEGNSKVTETVFENRFMHVNELIRMGAKITTEGRSASIEGPAQLTGCFVRCTDLRAGAAMILAGLVAEGQTEIGDLHHIDRGYENIVEKLTGLGADIERIENENV